MTYITKNIYANIYDAVDSRFPGDFVLYSLIFTICKSEKIMDKIHQLHRILFNIYFRL